MKIVLLADASSIHTQKWADYFAQSGHEVHILSFMPAELPGVNVHHLQLAWRGVINHSFSTLATAKKMLYLLHARQIKKWVRQIRPDVLHAHYATSYGILGALSGYHPYVISVWGSDILDFPRQSAFRAWLIKWILSRAERITATSRMLTQETRRYTAGNMRIKTIPFGVDIDRFSPGKQKSRETITIGIVKSLEEKYGISYLVRAFANCVQQHPDIRLSIVGGGSLHEALMKLCRELNIDKQVTLHGHIDNSLVPDYIRQMDVFVMPSVMESETFGVAVVEASACGVPVIASRIGGLPEVVCDGETGFLVGPRNVEQLTEKLLSLINDPGLRERMGKAGRQFVLENYDWSRNAELMLNEYKELMQNI